MGRKSKKEKEDEKWVDDFLKDIEAEEKPPKLREVVEQLKKIELKDIDCEIGVLERKIEKYEKELEEMKREMSLFKAIYSILD